MTAQRKPRQPARIAPRRVIRLAPEFYGDGPPYWESRKTGKPAKTAAQANDQRKYEAGLLRRYQYLYHRAGQLADIIDSCVPNYRCGTAACALCWRAYQRFVVASLSWLSGAHMGSVMVASIVPSGGIAPGNLVPENFLSFKGSVLRALTECGVLIAAGGSDININEGPQGPHWKFQSWIFMPGLTKAQNKQLRSYFSTPKHDVYVPVHLQVFDGDNAGLAYAMKGDFVRRQTIPRHQREDGSWIRQDTHDAPLRVEQKVELLIVRHQLGFDGPVDRTWCRSVHAKAFSQDLNSPIRPLVKCANAARIQMV